MEPYTDTTPTSIGYTQRTVSLDAVIRHQENIIKGLKKQLAENKFKLYFQPESLFWGKKANTYLTDTGRDLRRTIEAFEKGLVELREQLTEFVRADIGE